MHSRQTDRELKQADGPSLPTEAGLSLLDSGSADAKARPVVLPSARTKGGGTVPPGDPPAVSAPASEPDDFDLRRLRIRKEPGSALGIHKRLTTVPVRKPSKEIWVRTHPDRDACWLETYVIELKEDREVYLVSPELWPALAGESTFSARLLALAVSRDGTAFLWPIRLPGPDGKIDSWSQSAMDAAILAQSSWVRTTANMSLGAYEVYEASGIDAEPTWPTESMSEILKVAFRGKYIAEMDHPILKRLRGEV